MTEAKDVSSIRILSAALQMGAAGVIAAGVWWACFFVLPPLVGQDGLSDRLLFALKCFAVAVLLTFLTGVEGVAHERLTSTAFDPLAGKESRRLLINLRYLQNTLEQLIVFLPGLLLLAVYCENGSSMRAVVAATLVWILARIAFWIGYHIGPQQRVAGLIGTAQSMVVLLYVCARFGYELGGIWGASIPLVLFGVAESLLLAKVRP
jgi:MAPEG family protein